MNYGYVGRTVKAKTVLVYRSHLNLSIILAAQRVYQDNYLQFNQTETGKGAARDPVCLSQHSPTRLVHPVADLLTDF